MVVTAEAFAAQLDYLASNGFHVVRLSELADFLNGKRALPERSVVITIDDGYASTYEYALPLLKKHAFPATVFIYTDFIGARDALTWEQMREMVASGLVDIQSHSKTHANLSYRLAGESDEGYRKRLDKELGVPRQLLQGKLTAPVVSFAYPYGDASAVLVDRLAKADYRLAVTVNPGSNGFFAHPLMLQRIMIFGDHDLQAFKSKLEVFRRLDLQ
jgi:peptidoglycan/xylan/chitin deacetylase (PgdA/CDA1 family)